MEIENGNLFYAHHKGQNRIPRVHLPEKIDFQIAWAFSKRRKENELGQYLEVRSVYRSESEDVIGGE